MVSIGIDLGTTNSLAAVFSAEGAPKIIPLSAEHPELPSAVSLAPDGALLIGDAARARALTHPGDTATAFKRAIGTGKRFELGERDFSALELSSLLLKEMFAKLEAELDAQIEDLVITVPAYFNSVQREQTMAAAELAGIRVSRLVNEPTAAALAYGLQNLEEETSFIVLDLGGGTFDVTILEMFEGVMEVRASSGDAFLGGEDFTDALGQLLAERAGLEAPHAPEAAEALRYGAERIKRALSQQQEARISLVIGETAHDIAVSREDFETAAAELLARMRRPIEQALYDAKIRPDAIERVLLVGGATRMPMVRSLASRLFGRLPERGIDPDQIVAMGAAVQAGLCADDAALEDVVMTDSAPFSLGIATADTSLGVYDASLFAPIIERNTTIPASRSQQFWTMQKGQRQLRVSVYQGEAPMVRDNIHMGTLDVNVPEGEAGREGIDVRLSYDVSGLLQVDATVLSTGKVKTLTIEGSSAKLSEEERKRSRARLAELKLHPRDMQENKALTAELHELYAAHLGRDREVIMGLIGRFEAALATEDPREIRKAARAVREAIKSMRDGYVF